MIEKVFNIASLPAQEKKTKQRRKIIIYAKLRLISDKASTSESPLRFNQRA